jgi:hypothetical protein
MLLPGLTHKRAMQARFRSNAFGVLQHLHLHQDPQILELARTKQVQILTIRASFLHRIRHVTLTVIALGTHAH